MGCLGVTLESKGGSVQKHWHSPGHSEEVPPGFATWASTSQQDRCIFGIILFWSRSEQGCLLCFLSSERYRSWPSLAPEAEFIAFCGLGEVKNH
mmetsp:Transcript_28419/g.111468  ORF Transcript_28419/g.111468 Transcript_28419/m.111468 type:complete len:94 (+) Transcript_28419:213-494(+)